MKKKILILGGKPIGSMELTQRCHKRGLYTIVSDYLPIESSPAKRIADEAWDISTNDIDALAAKCKENGINGVLTAVHEFNINRMIDLCEKLELPCYCIRDTWKYCDNKLEFKKLCSDAGIEVAKEYDYDTAVRKLSDYTSSVIVKPIDSSGSRGFSICKRTQELEAAIEKAKLFSPTEQFVIEDYIPYDAVIIHYTMHQGKCYFSGMTDKYSVRFPSTGALVMGLQLMPSKGIRQFLDLVDSKARQMFENAGFSDGPIWIESFYDGAKRFVFNEMGYRFGGSMTNYPVQFFYQIDQMDLMIDVAMGEQGTTVESRPYKGDLKYCILPIHLRKGKIMSITGLDEARDNDDINAIAQVHYVGDTIDDWGSAQQVFCYAHILYKNSGDLINKINYLMQTIQVIDENNQNMLFTLFDINTLDDLC